MTGASTLTYNERFSIAMSNVKSEFDEVSGFCDYFSARVKDLTAENDELRDRCAQMTTEAEIWNAQWEAEHLENKKLRELVQGMAYCADDAHETCYMTARLGERPYTCCPLYDFDAKEYRCFELKRELGIETG